MIRLAALLFALLLVLPAAAQNAAPFDYYLLALSWSPQYCAEHGGEASAQTQCAGPAHGFVVHGLWPQFDGGGYPQSCQPAERVPRRLADSLLPIMPSERLVQHEWSTHGTCSGLSMEDYFGNLSRAYRKVQVPPILQAPHQRLSASVERIKQLFADANPGLAPAMMTVACGGRNRAVSEIHLCLDKSLNFRPCGAEVADSCRGGQGGFLPVE
jgi:ribonuclease T2